MKVLVVIISVVALCACGVATRQPVAPESSAPVVPAAGFDVLITDHDRAASVKIGQKIEVYLVQRAGMTSWSGIRADDQAVLGPSPIDFMLPPGVTAAGFVALATGTAQITSTAGPLCSPGQPCPQYAMLFSVTVTVT